MKGLAHPVHKEKTCCHWGGRGTNKTSSKGVSYVCFHRLSFRSGEVVCTDRLCGGTERGLVSITDGQEETMGVAVCAPTIDGRYSPINLGIMVLKPGDTQDEWGTKGRKFSDR